MCVFLTILCSNGYGVIHFQSIETYRKKIPTLIDQLLSSSFFIHIGTHTHTIHDAYSCENVQHAFLDCCGVFAPKFLYFGSK